MSKEFAREIEAKVMHEIERICKRHVERNELNDGTGSHFIVKTKRTSSSTYYPEYKVYLYKKGFFGSKDKRFKNGLVEVHFEERYGIPHKVEIYAKCLVEDIENAIGHLSREYPSSYDEKSGTKFIHNFSHLENKGKAFSK